MPDEPAHLQMEQCFARYQIRLYFSPKSLTNTQIQTYPFDNLHLQTIEGIRMENEYYRFCDFQRYYFFMASALNCSEDQTPSVAAFILDRAVRATSSASWA